MKRTEFRLIPIGIIALNLLNLFDAYFTYVGVSQDYLEELNPIMDYLLDIGPSSFFFCKITLVLLASIFLYLRRSHQLARRVVWLGCTLYTIIGGIHILHLINLNFGNLG